ncbi:hypothetical protein XFF6990_280068 [Xanthomonas citri pv. fuscans]|nr:hypothetical protein XFF6990_280068 [Xanthomonas citri pv. fuscans]
MSVAPGGALLDPAALPRARARRGKRLAVHRCKPAAIQARPYSPVEAAIGTEELWHISTQENLAFAHLLRAGCCADAAAAVRVIARTNAKRRAVPAS